MNKTALSRIESLDIVRGLIMIFMALDHAVEFIDSNSHIGSEFWYGKFPVYTNNLDFIMRYITHLCAPGFIFLMGISMVFFISKRKSFQWTQRECLLYYAKRAFILIALQFIYENVCWKFGSTSSSPFFYFGILWLFGVLMIVGSLCINYSNKRLIFLSLLSILITLISTNYFQADKTSWWQKILFVPGQDQNILVLFSIIPWLPSVFMGILCGRKLLSVGPKFLQKMPLIGTSLLCISFVIRLINQSYLNIKFIEITNFTSFFYATKYPPNLFYLCFTTGTIFVLIGFFSNIKSYSLSLILKPLSILGKSPLFFYLAHLSVYIIIAHILPNFENVKLRIFSGWGLGIVILVPLTYMYLNFKNAKEPNSLWRML